MPDAPKRRKVTDFPPRILEANYHFSAHLDPGSTNLSERSDQETRSELVFGPRPTARHGQLYNPFAKLPQLHMPHRHHDITDWYLGIEQPLFSHLHSKTVRDEAFLPAEKGKDGQPIHPPPARFDRVSFINHDTLKMKLDLAWLTAYRLPSTLDLHPVIDGVFDCKSVYGDEFLLSPGLIQSSWGFDVASLEANHAETAERNTRNLLRCFLRSKGNLPFNVDIKEQFVSNVTVSKALSTGCFSSGFNISDEIILGDAFTPIHCLANIDKSSNIVFPGHGCTPEELSTLLKTFVWILHCLTDDKLIFPLIPMPFSVTLLASPLVGHLLWAACAIMDTDTQKAWKLVQETNPEAALKHTKAFLAHVGMLVDTFLDWGTTTDRQIFCQQACTTDHSFSNITLLYANFKGKMLSAELRSWREKHEKFFGSTIGCATQSEMLEFKAYDKLFPDFLSPLVLPARREMIPLSPSCKEHFSGSSTRRQAGSFKHSSQDSLTKTQRNQATTPLLETTVAYSESATSGKQINAGKLFSDLKARSQSFRTPRVGEKMFCFNYFTNGFPGCSGTMLIRNSDGRKHSWGPCDRLHLDLDHPDEWPLEYFQCLWNFVSDDVVQEFLTPTPAFVQFRQEH